MSNMTYDDDMLLHYGRKGQKWGDHIFGRSRDSAFSSRRRRRREGGLDERAREIALLNLYRNRDRVSTRVLKEKISRIETEQKLKKLVEAPTIARVEAKRKRLQGRLQFAAKIASAGLDIYSKWPDNGVTKKFNPKTQKKELEKALDEFQYRKGIAKAIKDAPLTLTKFDDKGNINTSKLFQSVNVAGVNVYIPETIQNRFMIHHSGRKGMKWGLNIFGRRDRYARNNFSKEHYQIYKYVRERVKKGKSEYKLSKKIHSLTKDLYDSQPTEQNRLLTNMAYDARKKYKGSVKKIFNKYSETDFDLKGGLQQSGVNMGENINGIYIPSNDDILQQYGVKGMKQKKESDALETMPPDESDVNKPSIKKEEDSYNYNLKMRDAVIKNALKRIQDTREKNSSKSNINNHNKKTPKK